MSVRVSVNISGLTIRRANVRGKVADVVAVAAHRIEARAKDLVPVDTGATKNSIKPEFSQQGMKADIGPSTSYSVYLEQGTSKMTARPFMVPALEAERDPFVAAIKWVVAHG